MTKRSGSRWAMIVILAAIAVACVPSRGPSQETQAAPGNQSSQNAPSSPANQTGQSTSFLAGDDLTWPRIIKTDNETLSVYQPQVERWTGEEMTCRAAVSVRPAAGGEQIFGTVWITAHADVDKAARVVTLRDFKMTIISFPTAPEKDTEYGDILRKLLPADVKTIALDQLEASLAVSQAVSKQMELEVKNEPPRMIFSTRPALLILVDGDPVLRPLQGVNGVERVLNTAALIVKANGQFYLTAQGFWYGAASLAGPWTALGNPPALLDQAKNAAAATKMVDLIEPDANAPAPKTPLDVYVSTVPTELIQTDGPLQMLPIEGTNLLQVKNSDDVIMMDLKTNQYYVLLSGRWFRSKSIENGPWEFVSATALPADFAKIPPDHPRGNALVSVPGTPQAQEAAIANSIPQTAEVNRKTATATVAYDGAPIFQPIAGTSMFYAVNVAPAVIKVTDSAYFCVQNGVWFVASTPVGPWVVATYVPPVIYTIPVSCPVHNVTYVYVYDYTPEVVYVGYTPGYLGTVLCSDGVVVYGTGYHYRPYISSNIWIGHQWTYGFNVGFSCNDVTGFGFGFYVGYYHGEPCRPWWGPYNWGWHHRNDHVDFDRVNVNHVNFYHHWNRDVVSTPHHYVANRWENRGWTHTRQPFTPYSARTESGPRGWEGNARPHVDTRVARATTRGITEPVRTGGGVATGQQTSPTGRHEGAVTTGRETTPSGRHEEHNSTGRGISMPSGQREGQVATGSESKPSGRHEEQTTTGRGITAPSGQREKQVATGGETKPSGRHEGATVGEERGSTARTEDKANNVFAGRNGEVYRQTSSNRWQQFTRQGWQNAGDQAVKAEAPVLNREGKARQIGENRVDNFRASGGLSVRSGGENADGGGRRGFSGYSGVESGNSGRSLGNADVGSGRSSSGGDSGSGGTGSSGGSNSSGGSRGGGHGR